jgi:glutamate/tyrosine decarboxylase-like PLP-dependent enzyme/LmbE family N-acetylglucosaminyl deacetylase
MDDALRLLVVAAHPDDEALGFGGPLARYAAEGVATHLLTLTRGDRGRYFGHAAGTAEHPGGAALAELRERELRAASGVLGIGEVTLLEYGDGCVDRVPARDAIAAIVRELHRVRPHVVLTFAPDGAYGHPDHIAVSQFTTAAVASAGGVSKLYFLAWRADQWAAYQSAFKKLVSTVDGVERQATPWPDWAVTTVVDTRAWVDVVRRAVACHQSQVGAYAGLQALEGPQRDAIWGSWSFYRAISLVNGGRTRESDLFEGVPRPSNRWSSPRSAALSMDASTFSALGHRLVDQISNLTASVPERPVTADRSPATVRAVLGLGGPLPENGTDPAALVAKTAPLLFDQSLFNAHPRFFGYITAPPAPIGVLGDLMASALNPNVGSWTLAPAATEIEAETVRWIAQLVGYPTDCGGLLVSGGNLANIVCFLAARSAAAPQVRSAGVAAVPPLVAYVSEEAHTWIQKAADMSGLGTDAVRWIPTDAAHRMDVEALGRAIDNDVAAGCRPFFVAGTAGSVSLGVVDPLPAIAALCRERGIWFHVDGAYGAFAAALPDGPADLRGIADADSVAADPHKWLYAPLEAGCALVRDRDALRKAFSYHPPYYHFDEQATNFVDYGPQNSRGFRALKVWLALRHAGANGYRRMIADDIRLARTLASAVERHPDLELLTQSLSITTFRYVPRGLRARIGEPEAEKALNAINEALVDRLQRGGEVFVSNAVIRGRYALRACIVNFHTQDTDVEAVPDIVVRTARAQKAG